ncbi:hypothetical protein NM897_17390 (plasmid) [Planococcus maritimus]|uniref:hypothetical protein n=1 Tax=Planococcus maritimus TaxID=192421 RepID=UPI0031393682
MDFNLALIKKIGEDSVVLEFRGKQYEVELKEEEKQPLYDGMEEGVFLVPFDLKNEKILLTVDTQEVYEVFPEVKRLESELDGAVENYEEDEN